MPVGSLIIGFEMPQNPSGSSIPEKEFQRIVRTFISKHLSDWNIQPTRFQWVDEPDTPDDPTNAPSYIRGCFHQAGIEMDAIEPKSTGKVSYCLNGTVLTCYSRYALNWTNPGSPNPFLVQIPLGNGAAVTADLTCMLSFNQYGAP